MSVPPVRLSRRQVVHGAAAAALTLAGRPTAALAGRAARADLHRRAAAGLPATPAARVDPATLQALARRAVEAATAAGAQYADVRLTRTVQQFIFENLHSLPYIYGIYDDEFLGVGVRCLVGGAWGFASSPVWTPDEMVALAQTAAGQARASAAASAARGIPPVEWTPAPVVQGDWSTPHAIDPFTVPLEERADFAMTMMLYYLRLQGWLGMPFGGAPLVADSATIWRQEQALATSEGSYVTQTLYRMPLPAWRSTATGPHPGTPPPSVGSGWEVHQHDQARLRELIPQVYEEVRVLAALPTKAVELGKYDVVLDGGPTAGLVSATLAPATQLDRALGYEANAGGASFVGPDPLAQLGRLQLGAPLLTLRTAPTLPHGAATWQWDAEGVVPAATTLIQDGVLVDFQTTREQAAWLRPYYEKVGQPVRSRGCAAAPSALELTLQHPPNLVLAPGSGGTSGQGTPGQEMIKSIKRGLYIFRGVDTAMDRSVGTGTLAPSGDNSMLNGGMREIVNGKLGAKLVGGVLPFRTTELWRHLVAVGPAAEAQQLDAQSTKGEPAQSVGYTVRAVPTQFTNLVVTR